VKQTARSIEAFNRIIGWLEGHRRAKSVLPSLRPPATAKAVAEFEARAKVKLPPGLAALYRRHDGQDEDAANELLDGETIESGLFPSIEGRGDLPFLLVPLKELARGVRGGMPGFRKGWIPFGDNYGGDHMVIDLTSTDPGKRGRVLQFNHEYGCAAEMAPSFEQYLEQIADGLAAKKIIWDEDSGLSYKRGRDWDDLIEKKKVECDEDPADVRPPELKTSAKGKRAGGARIDPELLGRWKVIELKTPPGPMSAILAGRGTVVEFTAAGDFVTRPPKGSLARAERHRFVCARNHQPPWIDLADHKFRDMRALGIYRLDGDQLLLCVNRLREPRPASFDTAEIVHRMERRK
jgi:uncharacterized protein (TIGR03067 family)